MQFTDSEILERLIWIVDFGSQYTQLITRKTRELGYSSCLVTLEQVMHMSRPPVPFHDVTSLWPSRSARMPDRTAVTT